MSFNLTLCGNPGEPHQNKGVSDLKNPTIKKETIIKVNEIFGPTIQGEGKSMGKEVMFLRTAGCNLACVWCDTPYTWNWKGTKFEHPDKFDPKKEIHDMTPTQITTKIRALGPNIKSLVISGGEPMLQQNKLIEVLQELKKDNYWVEIETNGTITPSKEFIELIDQINCSPKLASSGKDNTLEKREKVEALTKLALEQKVWFKFVVCNDNDLREILELVKKYNMQRIFLMPEGRTKEEQEARQDNVKRLCQENGFEFSPRLHILKWGAKRAV